MIVSRSTYNGLVNRAATSMQNSQDAYDRLDQVLGENERLLKLLEDERNRNQDMAACVIDTLREALGMDQPKPIPSDGIPGAQVPFTPQMPKEIDAAIAETFPDDTVIRSANIKYAYSQQHRWEGYATEIADEIRQGA